MSLKTAILFNGAASYIAQEAGMLDLLLGNVDGVPGVGLNIQQDVKFVGGISSGALMTFAVNAAFCENPPLSWDYFKNEILFKMTTAQVYTIKILPFNTDPLRQLLINISEKANYHTLRDLPFDSAILAAYPIPTQSRFSKKVYETFWLSNIQKVADQLPEGSCFHQTIRKQQLNLDLVSSLMCSTAIPHWFPKQNLSYKEDNLITNQEGKAIRFCDGGSGGVFKEFKKFFDTYEQKFDILYFISPNFASNQEEAYRLIVDTESAVNKIDKQNFMGLLDIEYFMNSRTEAFIKELQEYNSNCCLANKIYYCKPVISGYKPLKFAQEKEQYDETISWGLKNPEKIAINIENYEPTV